MLLNYTPSSDINRHTCISAFSRLNSLSLSPAFGLAMVTRCDDVAIPSEVIVKSWNDERFLYPDLIMKGSRSCVFKCLDSLSGNTVALKIIGFPRSGPNKLEMHVQVHMEMSALQTLQHPNILSSILCSYGPIHATIAMPYFECDLKKYVEDTGALSHKVTQGLISQALQGLSYIHAHGIVHDNLRLEHLLLNNLNADTMTLVIGGLSRIHFPSYEVKNNSYDPPEILGKTATTCASDIWALGCILATMLKGYYPFTTQELNSQEVNLEALFPNIDKLGLDLLKKMLHPNPCQRITASQALVHPYFQSVQNS